MKFLVGLHTAGLSWAEDTVRTTHRLSVGPSFFWSSPHSTLTLEDFGTLITWTCVGNVKKTDMIIAFTGACVPHVYIFPKHETIRASCSFATGCLFGFNCLSDRKIAFSYRQESVLEQICAKLAAEQKMFLLHCFVNNFNHTEGWVTNKKSEGWRDKMKSRATLAANISSCHAPNNKTELQWLIN